MTEKTKPTSDELFAFLNDLLGKHQMRLEKGRDWFICRKHTGLLGFLMNFFDGDSIGWIVTGEPYRIDAYGDSIFWEKIVRLTKERFDIQISYMPIRGEFIGS